MIITNILAVITSVVVTNSTERFPQHWVNDPRPPGYEFLAIAIGHMENVPNPQMKWVRTVAKEQRLLNFSFEGKEWSELLSEKVVSDVEVQYRIVPQQPTWEPISTNRMDVPIGWFGTATNYCTYESLVITNLLSLTNSIYWKQDYNPTNN